MQKGMKFKLLPAKDIRDILAALRIHPQVTIETLDCPSSEAVAAMLQQLSVEIGYELDVLQVKAVMPPNIPHPEIYDEAKEGLITMKFSQQLAFANGIDDFSLRDIWEPSTKRLRNLLSGIINFLRYRDKQQSMITSLKEDLHALQDQRLDLVQKSALLDDKLQEAHAKHNEELPLMHAADNEAHEARNAFEKVQKEVKLGEAVLDDTAKRNAVVQERVEQRRREAKRLRDEVEELQGSIADSPEDLTKRIHDLRARIPQMRDVSECKHHEKRDAVQRIQAYARLKSNTTEYLEKLRELLAEQVKIDEIRQQKQGEIAELASLREKNERLRAQLAQQEHCKEEVTSGIEHDRQAHADRLRNYEERRQKAFQERQEQQAKLTEEQRRQHAQRAERFELENQLADAKRAHQTEIAKIQSRRCNVLDDLVDFNRLAEKELGSSLVLEGITLVGT